jgi:hypothetical protein
MLGLVMLVLAALCVVGLLSWLSGNAGVLSVVGGVLAELFGVVAWLVPVSVGLGAVLLLVGAKANSRWTSPLVPFGLTLMLLGAMGFIHLFANGQAAADAGQGGGYLGLAISTLLSDYLTRVGAGVVLVAVATLGFMLAFGVSLGQLIRGVGKPTVKAGRFAGKTLGRAGSQVSRLLRERSASRATGPGSVRINGQLSVDDDAPATQDDADEEETPARQTYPGSSPARRNHRAGKAQAGAFHQQA